MIRTLALPLFVGYTTTLPPPHQRLSSDELTGSNRRESNFLFADYTPGGEATGRVRLCSCCGTS
jgi:hypothetical protein